MKCALRYLITLSLVTPIFWTEIITLTHQFQFQTTPAGDSVGGILRSQIYAPVTKGGTLHAVGIVTATFLCVKYI